MNGLLAFGNQVGCCALSDLETTLKSLALPQMVVIVVDPGSDGIRVVQTLDGFHKAAVVKVCLFSLQN